MLAELKPEKKARIEARLPEAQKKRFEKAANIAGYGSLSDFVVQSVREKADAIISEKERILGSEEDKAIFFKAIMYPSAPNDALKAAAAAYKTYLAE